MGSRGGVDAPLKAMDFGDPPAAPAPPELAGARQLTLPNGLRVVLVRRPQFPAVTTLLSFHGGAAASPPGMIELLRNLEGEGTFSQDQNALQIRKADGDDYAADLVVTGWRNLSNALAMLAARLQVIAQIDWGRVMPQVQRAAERVPRRDSPAKLATRAFWRALYPNHAYGRSIGIEQMVDLEPAALRDWLPHLYNPANATLIIAGDFNPPYAEDLVTRWFGKWKGASEAGALDVAAVPPVPRSHPPETVLVTHRPGSTQVNLLLGCRLPGGRDPRDLATARMLAGVVADRLSTRLREEMGAAYTVTGSAAVIDGGGAHIQIGAAIDNRRFREALQVIRADWDHYARGGFDRGTLSQVRWDLTRGALLGYQTSTDTAVRVLEGVNQGWSPAVLASLPDAYRTVGAAELGRAFQVCRASTVLSLLGDKPSIDAALR
jgi:zinc protease